jgi:hypothetical protein
VSPSARMKCDAAHRPTYSHRNGIVKTSNADAWTSQKIKAERTPND